MDRLQAMGRSRALLIAGCLSASMLAVTPPAQAGGEQVGHAAINKAKAKKLAKAGTLTRRDLPRASAERMTYEATDAEDDRALYECLGAKAPTYLARNEGFRFVQPPLMLYSSAAVLSTPKQAKADVKALRSPEAVECLKQEPARGFERDGNTVESVALKRVPVRIAGVTAAFGYLYDVRGTIQGSAIRIRALDVYILVGQTELLISQARFDGRPPTVGKARSLAEIVLDRVRAV